jgi:RNA polymerase sigma-70 factor (ECF subfamily)
VEEIYRAHFGFVWAVLRRLGVPERDLEDVAQDVFVVVHRRLPEFQGRASTRTWLYAIAVRVAWNHGRKRRVREPAAETSGSHLIAPPLGSDPEEHALRTQAARVLDDLLARLDDDKRAVFVLSDIEGLTAVEIAEIVGTNARTVYSRLRAARDRVHGDLARMQSREQSAAERRTWLRAAASGDAPPAQAERRVWAALALRLPMEAIAKIGWPVVAQAITVSLALGVGGLGAVWVAAAPLRDAPIEPRAQAERDATSTARSDVPEISPARGEPTTPRGAVDAQARRDTPATTPSNATVQSPRTPRTRTETRPPQPSEAAPAPAPDDALLLELPLLERAREALARGDVDAALRELDEHARRFETSALAADRERLRARASAAR